MHIYVFMLFIYIYIYIYVCIYIYCKPNICLANNSKLAQTFEVLVTKIPLQLSKTLRIKEFA